MLPADFGFKAGNRCIITSNEKGAENPEANKKCNFVELNSFDRKLLLQWQDIGCQESEEDQNSIQRNHIRPIADFGGPNVSIPTHVSNV